MSDQITLRQTLVVKNSTERIQDFITTNPDSVVPQAI